MYANSLEITRPRARLLSFVVLLSLAVWIPAAGLPQPITGPLVNALLLLAVCTLGLGPALLLGLITPLGGLVHGILPLPLLAMLPFVALGNAALVATFAALRRPSHWLALVLAAAAKTALLSAAAWLVAGSLGLPPALLRMMTWPQFLTALLGGLLALGLLAATRLRPGRF